MTTIPETINFQAGKPPGLLSKVFRRLRNAFALFERDNARVWLRRITVAAWMNVLIAAAAAVTAVTAGLLAEKHWPYSQTWDVDALKLFAFWCLSFLPGWLYVRFIGMRAKALWNEYVLNLHRLGWDLPENLPEPPPASEFHDRWEQKHKPQPAGDNIYQQKFEAYYGRDVPRAAMNNRPSSAPGEEQAHDSGREKEYRVSGELLFPVFLATAVLAVGWSAVLWDTRFLSGPNSAWDVLKYGFIGAYAFVTLLIHLDRTDRTELNDLRDEMRQESSKRRQGRQDGAPAHAGPYAESGAAARLNLRRAGIRTATDLLKAFSKEAQQPGDSLPERTFVPQPKDQQLPLPESQLRLLVTVLGAEPGLVPIWNWQRNGVPACRNQTPDAAPAGQNQT